MIVASAINPVSICTPAGTVVPLMVLEEVVTTRGKACGVVVHAVPVQYLVTEGSVVLSIQDMPLYRACGGGGEPVTLGGATKNLSARIPNSETGVPSLFVEARPKPVTCPPLSILTVYFPCIPSIEEVCCVISVV